MASHDISKFVDGSGDEFNFRDPTKESLANKVTSVRASSSATDDKYPSEKAVASAIEALDVSSVGGSGKYISAISESDGKISATATTMDTTPTANSTNAVTSGGIKTAIDNASTADRLYANQKWGGAFRTNLSPFDSYAFKNSNCFFGAKPSAIRVEYSTDGGTTWTDYGLTDEQKVKLFSQYEGNGVYCGKNTHIQPGYTGSISGTKDLSNDNIADQRLRITICDSSLDNEGTTSTTDRWLYCNLRRIGIYMSTQSAGGGAHCLIEKRTSANFKSATNTWVTVGDYKIQGDPGWNSIPCGNDTADGAITFGQNDSQCRQIRFTIWSDLLNASPATSQTGNLMIQKIVAYSEIVWTSNSSNSNVVVFGSPYSVIASTGVTNFAKGIKFTARKLKTNLARTSDSTFDGSADQENIPVTGTLPVGNGGTGKASVTSGNYLVGNGTSAFTEKTPKDAGSDVLKSLDTDNGDVVDGDYIVTSYHVDASTISSTTFVRRTAEKLWNYIKSNISSVLGLSTTGYTGNAATATKATQDSDGSAINTTYKKLAESSKFTVPQWIDDNTRTSYNDLRIGNSFKLLSLGISGNGNFLLKELADGRTNSPSSDKSIIYTSNGGTLYNFNGNAATASALADETGFVHTTGNETVGGTKTFSASEVVSESSAGTYSGFFVKRTSVDDGNKVYKVSLEVNDDGSRGVYDYGGTGLNGENKWILRKRPDGSIAIGESTNINKISIGGITLDFSGSLGNAANTLYFGWAGGGSS